MTEPVKEKNVGSRWEKGRTGNPNGRPRKDKTPDAELLKMQKLLRKHTVEAVQKVIQIMQTAQTPELQLKTSTWVVEKCLVVDREVERRGVGAAPEPEEKPKQSAPVLRLTMTDSSGTKTKLDLDQQDDE